MQDECEAGVGSGGKGQGGGDGGKGYGGNGQGGGDGGKGSGSGGTVGPRWKEAFDKSVRQSRHYDIRQADAFPNRGRDSSRSEQHRRR